MNKPTKAADIMVTDLVTLRPEMDVYDAIEQLLHHRISGAPVVDGEGTFLGVLSELDCIHRLAEGAAQSLPSSTVDRCMTRDVPTIHEETHLLSIADTFIQSRLRRLPVLREGKLVGQISRRDVLNAFNRVLKKSGGKEHESAFLYLSAVRGREEISL